jgi:hypothetical protein
MRQPAHPDQFLNLSFEYYLTGRQAAMARLVAAANLFHHAIELLMKYQLVKDVPNEGQATCQQKLRSRQYGHKLRALWPEFKSASGDSTLAQFNQVVSDLDRWEDIRYGGFPLGLTIRMEFSDRKVPPVQQIAGQTEDVYTLSLEQIDELYTAMLSASSVMPEYLTDLYLKRPENRAMYDPWNSHRFA